MDKSQSPPLNPYILLDMVKISCEITQSSQVTSSESQVKALLSPTERLFLCPLVRQALLCLLAMPITRLLLLLSAAIFSMQGSGKALSLRNSLIAPFLLDLFLVCMHRVRCMYLCIWFFSSICYVACVSMFV